jgi:hypothetical protein
LLPEPASELFTLSFHLESIARKLDGERLVPRQSTKTRLLDTMALLSEIPH